MVSDLECAFIDRVDSPCQGRLMPYSVIFESQEIQRSVIIYSCKAHAKVIEEFTDVASVRSLEES